MKYLSSDLLLKDLHGKIWKVLFIIFLDLHQSQLECQQLDTSEWLGLTWFNSSEKSFPKLSCHSGLEKEVSLQRFIIIILLWTLRAELSFISWTKQTTTCHILTASIYSEISFLSFYFSYAREWHEKLRELKESHGSGLTMTVKTGPRSPAREALHTSAGGVSSKPEITIKPAFKLLSSKTESAHITPLKVDPSGALNLSTGSPSPELTSPNSATSPDTSTRISPAPPARSPQGYRPPSYNSVELCVVCGDRASGEWSSTQLFFDNFSTNNL